MSEKENKNEEKTGVESDKKEKLNTDKNLDSAVQTKNKSFVEQQLKKSDETTSKVAETKKVSDNSAPKKKNRITES